MEKSAFQSFLNHLVKTVPQLFAIDLTKIKESLCQKFISTEFNLHLQKIIFCNFNESDKFIIHTASNKYFTLKIKEGGYVDIFIDISHFIKELYTNENGLRLVYTEILLMANVKDCINFYAPLHESAHIFNYEWLLRISYDDYFDFLVAINKAEKENRYLKCIVDALFLFIEAGKYDKIFSAEYYDMIDNINPDDEFMVSEDFFVDKFSINSAILLLQEASDIKMDAGTNYILYFSKNPRSKNGKIFRDVKIEPIRHTFPTYESCMNYLFMNKDKIKKYCSYSVQCELYQSVLYAGMVTEEVHNILTYDTIKDKRLTTPELVEIHKKIEDIKTYLSSIIV